MIAAAVVTFAACWGILFMTQGRSAQQSPRPAQPTGVVSASPATVTPSPGVTADLRRIGSITFVADVSADASAPGSASALTWIGVQRVGAAIGAEVRIAAPRNQLDLARMIDDAARSSEVVVTLGAGATAATEASADAHPGTEFVALDQVPLARPNIRSVVFDEVEVGYLAGFIAGALSPAGTPGFIAGDPTQGPSANHEAGFQGGVKMAGRSGLIESAGSDDHADLGRAALGRLIGRKVDYVALPDTLTGLGATREACNRRVEVVGLGTDLYARYQTERNCVAASVVRQFDVAVVTAIADYASDEPPTTILVADVASGGITVSDFHVVTTVAFGARLAQILATLKASPPRSSPAP